MKYFSFKLHVKPHIQKYLTALYGVRIPANLESEVGLVVLNIISSRMESKVCRWHLLQSEERHQGEVTFMIPINYYYLTQKDVSKLTRGLLNRYFESRFQTDLCRHVSAYTQFGGGYKAAIEKFADMHGIVLEEDITFDGLKKIEYRHRKKNLEKAVRSLSPTQNLFQPARA